MPWHSRWGERLDGVLLSCPPSQLTFSSRSITAVAVIDRATSKPPCSPVYSSITLQILKGFALVVAIELEVQCPHMPQRCRWLRARRWHRQAPLLTSFARQDPQTLLVPQVAHHITATGKTSLPGFHPSAAIAQRRCSPAKVTSHLRRAAYLSTLGCWWRVRAL